MKKNSKVKRKDYSKFTFEDSLKKIEYYGLFKIKGVYKIDVKRFKKTIEFIDENVLKQLDITRDTVYFQPKYKKRSDYNISFIVDYLNLQKINLEETFDSIKFYTNKEKKCYDEKIMKPGDSFGLQTGIMEYDEVCAEVNLTNAKNYKKMVDKILKYSSDLQLGFIHRFVSGLEAVILKIMVLNGYKSDEFNRNSFYDFYDGKIGNRKTIKIYDMESYKPVKILYAIWNFLKHNSFSTYSKLKELSPKLLSDIQFNNGDYAGNYLKITKEDIYEYLNGTADFFIKLFKLAYDEDYDDSKWNYEEYFIKIVKDKIREEYNNFHDSFC